MAARGTLSSPTAREQTVRQEEKRRSPLRRLHTKGVMWVAVALATIAALAYVMIEVGVLGVGPAKGPAGIVYAAAGGYLLGGLLILVRRRWLWMIGATIKRACRPVLRLGISGPVRSVLLSGWAGDQGGAGAAGSVSHLPHPHLPAPPASVTRG